MGLGVENGEIRGSWWFGALGEGGFLIGGACIKQGCERIWVVSSNIQRNLEPVG